MTLAGKTFIPKREQMERKCYLFDAENQVLGRLATRIAVLLMGKDEPWYTPYMDCGDHVVVINARGIVVTGRKAKQKMYQRYTGYPGGRRLISYEKLHAEHPDRIIKEAVRRMLPKNRLAAKMLRRLKVFPSSTHSCQSLKPVPVPSS